MNLKMKVKVMDYSNRNDAIRWQISSYIKDITHFARAFTVAAISSFQILHLKIRTISATLQHTFTQKRNTRRARQGWRL